LFLKGERCHSGKCPMNDTKSTGLPGKDPRARSKKPTNYGLQLREKQKLKRTYCMLEKQFKLTFDEAARIPGKTGENLIMLLEQRLDNVVFRLHFAASRNQAAQFVNHGHIFVNGKRVSIPSYRLRPGDVVSVGAAGSEDAHHQGEPQGIHQERSLSVAQLGRGCDEGNLPCCSEEK